MQAAWMVCVVASIPGRSSSLPIVNCTVAVSFGIYWSGCSIDCLTLPLSYPVLCQIDYRTYPARSITNTPTSEYVRNRTVPEHQISGIRSHRRSRLHSSSLADLSLSKAETLAKARPKSEEGENQGALLTQKYRRDIWCHSTVIYRTGQFKLYRLDVDLYRARASHMPHCSFPLDYCRHNRRTRMDMRARAASREQQVITSLLRAIPP